MTKNYRIKYWLCAVLSFLFNVAPLAAYVIMASCADALLIEKITLSMTILVVIILSLVSWLNKIAMRSRLWILMIGLYACLDNIMTPLLVVASCQILDELAIIPLKNHYRAKLSIWKELDKRDSLSR